MKRRKSFGRSNSEITTDPKEFGERARAQTPGPDIYLRDPATGELRLPTMEERLAFGLDADDDLDEAEANESGT